MWEELIGRLTSIPQNNANEQLQATSSRSGPLERSVMSGKAFVWGSGSERPVFWSEIELSQDEKKLDMSAR